MSKGDNAEAMLMHMCEQLRALPHALEQAMPQLTQATEDYIRDCIDRKIDPDTGKPWERTVIGRPALMRGDTLRVAHRGNTIFASLRAHEAMHTHGTAHGKKVRRMLPTKMNAELAARMKAIVDREIAEALA